MDSLRNGAAAHEMPGSGRLLRSLGLAAAVLLLGLVLASCQAEKGTPTPATTNSGGTTYSFNSDIKPVLTSAGCYDCHLPDAPDVAATCQPCHSDGRLPDTVAELDHDNLVGVTSTATTGGNLRVDAGSSATSVLFWVASQDPTYTSDGGAMISQMKPTNLTNAQVQMIKDWIDQGASP